MLEDVSNNRGFHRRTRRNGVSILYVIVMLATMMGIVSLAVDRARVELARTQLRASVDAAARYGAAQLPNGITAVQNAVVAAAQDNTVDTTALVIDSNNDIEFGVWDSKNKVFQVLSGAERAGATAIRVTGRRIASRSTGVPTIFASVFGKSSQDVVVQAIASRGRVTSTDVDAAACPWLAGMPNGSSVAATGGNTQSALVPYQSPAAVSGIPIVAGSKLSFRQATGTTTYTSGGQGSGTQFGPDGNIDRIVGQASTNGINTTYAPLNCLVGIFLDDNAPSSSAAKSTLDFTSASSRDFTTLSPQLKQVFFIGDGINSSSQLQQFVVPAGATRFYLGIMDEKGWWWDNVGTINISTVDSTVTIVK